MEETNREVLARRLSSMKLKEAQREIRAMDREANMVYWRNGMKDECHTLFLLPNAELAITLVERITLTDSQRKIGGGPRGSKAQKASVAYVEARVEPLDRPAHKRGGAGPSPLKRLEHT